MGIISAAMAAAGNSGVESMNQNIEQMNRQELMDKQAAINSDADQRRSDLETQKQLVILQAQKKMAIDAANQQRESQIARINQAIPALVQNQIDTKYADANAAAAGKTDSPLTPEQQAVIDQSKAADKTALANDPHSYIKAAMATGDIDPHTVAQLAQQVDAIRRQELSQQAQFEHADKAQKESFAHADKAQAASQAFAAKQQALQIAASRQKDEVDPDTLEANAKLIANYELPSPSGFAAAKPVAQKMLQRAKEINPNFDAKNYKVIQNLDDKFKSGKQGDQVRSVNAAMEHLDLYKQLAEAQKAKDIPMFNRIAAKLAQETGSAIPTDINVAASIVGPEIAKVMVPGGGGVHERDSYVQKFSVGNSPAQALGVADTYLGLMAGQLRGFARQYSYVPGADPEARMEKFRNFLSPEANVLLDRHSTPSAPPINAPTNFGKKDKPSLNDIFGG